MASGDEKFDLMLLGLAQQHTGGIDQLLDTFFGFLRRKTDFFTAATEEQIKQKVWKKIQEHQKLAISTTKAESDRRKAQEEANRIEKENREKKLKEIELQKKLEAEQQQQQQKQQKQQTKKKKKKNNNNNNNKFHR